MRPVGDVFKVFIGFAIGAIFFFSGCSRSTESNPVAPPTEISFAQSIQPIFTQRCALSGCHAGSSPAQGMSLEAGKAYGNIVNVPSREKPELMRVKPDSSSVSYLVQKIRGVSGIVGARMPFGASPLTDAQIQTIAEWVDQGARNN